jgi:hypothetical protein
MNWIKRDNKEQLVVTAVTEQADSTILLELADSKGTLWYKEIVKHPNGKGWNFLVNHFGADIRNFQGKKIWFGEVGKYFLPVRAE